MTEDILTDRERTGFVVEFPARVHMRNAHFPPPHRSAPTGLDLTAEVRIFGGHIEHMSLLALHAWLLRCEGRTLVLVERDRDRRHTWFAELLQNSSVDRPAQCQQDAIQVRQLF